jgi:hypothetical protein
MTGGNILSKNNIYSSINFEQSGGNILPSSATRIRNILTRYITGGLISVNTISLLDMIQEHLSASGKGFNNDDLTHMKTKLEELRAQEFNLLKNLVYVNTMLNDVSGSNDYLNFNKAPTYELTGGAPSGVVSIIEKLMKRTKPESSVFVNTLEQLKNTISGLKSNVENTRNYVLPYKMNNNAMGYRADGANYAHLKEEFTFTLDGLFRYDGVGTNDLLNEIDGYTIGGNAVTGVDGPIAANAAFTRLFELAVFDYIIKDLNNITEIVWDQTDNIYIVKTTITNNGLGQLAAAITSIARTGDVPLSKQQIAEIIKHRINHPGDDTINWNNDYNGDVEDPANDGRDIDAGPRPGGVDVEHANGINLKEP